ncbi:hypothetical protein [Rhizobium sp. AU243]|uniref:SMa0974 family conjugal transfer regulator n=1 Tax=Rhizobium sp. AU243 TaxID=2303425 RepID=UPI0010CB8942|nr:hypothetical protein [Rhizobium sp. AU243]TKV70748.1 hypothetical protein D0C28_25345 [Rhizobium sp. AU243]
MHDHIAEGFIHAENSSFLIEYVCNRISQLCQSISQEQHDWLLNFGEGTSILRPKGARLLFRIVAQNVLVLYGIQTAIEGSLATLSTGTAHRIEWVSGTNIPFAAIEELIRDRRF